MTETGFTVRNAGPRRQQAALPVGGDILCPNSPRGWLAKAGHVPADLIRGGRVVVAIRTQLVDPSALLIWENNWLASHEHPSASPVLGFMVSHFWEPTLQLGTDTSAEASVFCFPAGKVLALKLVSVVLFPEEAERLHGFVGL